MIDAIHELHAISPDVRIGYVGEYAFSIYSDFAKRSRRESGAIGLTIEELDAIYAYVHKDDVLELDCNTCIYTKLCDFAPRTSDGRENYMLIGQTGNLVTPDDTPAEVEKLVCGNCYYIDDVDCGSGYCYRYPPTENELGVSETNRACGEHRLRE